MKLVLVSTVIGALVVMTGCSKKAVEDKPNMTELQQEQGVPVTVISVKKGSVEKISKYSGGLEGARQKGVYATLPEYIKKISVEIGEYVKKDQVLAELDTDGVTPYFKQAKAGYDIALKTFQRMETVFEKGGISQQQFDEVSTQLALRKADYEATKKRAHVLAPFDGVIIDIFFKEGTVAISGKDEYPMMKIAQIKSMIMKVSVSSQEIHKFRKGLSAYTLVDGKKIGGVVDKVPLAANPVTRFFDVDIRFTNNQFALKPGMFIQAHVITDEKKGLYVNASAVHYDDSAAFIYVVRNGVAKKEYVTVILENDDVVLLQSGVQEGDKVVLTGATRLVDGARVMVKKQITNSLEN